MVSGLKIKLLGPFQVELDGEFLLNFRSAKELGLLYYLSVETEKSLTREFSGDLFWLNYPERKARSNFCNAVWNLQRELGEFQPGIPDIVSKNSKLQLNPKVEFWLVLKILNDLIEILV